MIQIPLQTNPKQLHLGYPKMNKNHLKAGSNMDLESLKFFFKTSMKNMCCTPTNEAEYITKDNFYSKLESVIQKK